MNSDFFARQIAPLVIAALVVALGILPATSVLDSHRPVSRDSLVSPSVGSTVFNRRIADDPLSRIPDQLAAALEPDQSLDKVLKRHLEKFPLRAILIVVTPSQPYPEMEERRRRDRVAIQLAAAEKGFAPTDADHLEFSFVDGDLEQSSVGPPLPPQPILCPVEYLRPTVTLDAQGAPGDIAVVWLGNDVENHLDLPSKLQYVLSHCPEDVASCVLGPPTSGDLIGLLSRLAEQEAGAGRWTRNTRHTLANTPIVSATATAPEKFLDNGVLQMRDSMQAVSAKDPKGSTARAPLVGRSVATDDALIKALVEEVVKHRRAPFGRKRGRVVLLYEQDTPYGRAQGQLAASEIERVENQRLMADPGADPSERLTVVSVPYLRGLDGAGPLAKTSTSSSSAQGNKPPAPIPFDQITSTLRARVGDDPAFGEARGDYVRRLARLLKTTDLDANPPPVIAVGLLGTDFYDKLLLLQALRPEFGDAVFFTSVLDARMLDADARAWTRNLVVASSAGLSAGSMASFRDSAQTSVYQLACRAIENPDEFAPLQHDVVEDNVHLFEIGRTAEVRLSSIDSLPTQSTAAIGSWEWLIESNHIILAIASMGVLITLLAAHVEGNPRSSHGAGPAGQVVRQPSRLAPIGWTIVALLPFLANEDRPAPPRGLAALLWCWTLLFGAILVAAQLAPGGAKLGGIALWTVAVVTVGIGPLVARSQWNRTAQSRSNDESRRLMVLIVVALLLGLVPLIISVWFQASAAEPETWTQGVSILPTELIRIVCAVAAFFAMVVFWIRLRQQMSELADRFGWGSPQQVQGLPRSTPLDYLLLTWHSDSANASDLWFGLMRRSTPRAILLRVLPTSLLWTLSLSLLFVVWPPIVPARGASAFTIDFVCLLMFVPSVTVLNMLIWDRIRTCIRFIALLPSHTETNYPETALATTGEPHQLGASLVELDLINSLTSLPRKILYVPILLFVIGTVARSRLFDNWQMSVSIALSLALSVAVTVHSAVLLRKAARDARDAEIDRLEACRGEASDSASQNGKPGKGPFRREDIERVIKRVREFDKGPFGRIERDPAVQAVLIALTPFLITLISNLVTTYGS